MGYPQHAMQPLLMSADFDPFQVAIVVIFVVASFLKWLWENRTRGGVDASHAPTAPDAVEKRLRDEAWRRQTGRRQPPPLPAPTAAPPSPWEELRKAWTEVKEAAAQTASQSPAKPPRTQHPRRAVEARTAQVAEKIAAPPPVTPSAQVIAAHPTVVSAGSKQHEPAFTVRDLRLDAASLRQAVILKEILGSPKALQTSTDLAI